MWLPSIPVPTTTPELEPDSHHRLSHALWWNQVWETVSAGLKALFVFFLTPLMLHAWGRDGFGQFAVASSLFILLSVFDFGIRPALRVNLASAVGRKDAVAWRSSLQRALAAYLVLACVVVALALGLWFSGLGGRLAGLGSESSGLVMETVLLSQFVVLSQMLLEPLMAHDRVGTVKFAAAASALLSLGCVFVVLLAGGSVEAAVAAWLLPLGGVNLITWFVTGTHREWRQAPPTRVHFRESFTTVKNSVGYNFINAMWLAKTHGLTLVVAHLAGESVAGVFFLVLRLSELIGVLGAVGCDAGMAPLARAAGAEERQRAFVMPYRFTALCMGQAALIITFYGSWLLELLHVATAGSAAGWLAALLGISIGMNRIFCLAGMSLGLLRTCSLLAGLEASVTLILAANGSQANPIHWCVWSAIIGSIVLLPLAWKIAHCIPGGVFALWVQPLGSIAWVWAVSWAVLQIPAWLQHASWKFPILALVAALTVLPVLGFRRGSVPTGSPLPSPQE
jgi:O-antigen/teichoic acid export membrane protein